MPENLKSLDLHEEKFKKELHGIDEYYEDLIKKRKSMAVSTI